MSTRIRHLASVLALVGLLVLLLIAAERSVALAQRLAMLPAWLQWLVGIILVLFALAAMWLVWTWLRPRPRRPRQTAPPDRASINERIEALARQGAEAAPLRAELDELDSRRRQGKLYLALFGEISSGKSSLAAALVPGSRPRIDVTGGSTTSVDTYEGRLADGTRMCVADVPGSREAGGEIREALARDEALRAHVVIYVATGDLSRSQADELRWLGEFGKPVILVLNKADQWRSEERTQLLTNLRRHAGSLVDAVVATRAGGSERFQRILPDGRTESVERDAVADIDELRQAIDRAIAPGSQVLETARERAVLAGLHQRTRQLEADQRALEAQRIVGRYTRRAVVGALAAVAPGSDLVIQGVLATAMARELGKLYDAPISDVELDAYLKNARMNLRASTSIVLAIAGNAMKAFPGLGTIGGGIAHAFAYALIFDSLGKALAATLAEYQRLDADAASARMHTLLGEASGQRLRRLAALTVDAVRHRDDVDGPAP